MLVLMLDMWPADTSENSPLAQATLPCSDVSLSRTIKGNLLKITFTLQDRTINSPYTAATFSEETIDEGNRVMLSLYG